MRKPINMATGGLMNRPIGSREENIWFKVESLVKLMRSLI